MNLKRFITTLFCVFSFYYFLNFSDIVSATGMEEELKNSPVFGGEDVSNNIEAIAERISLNTAPELTIIDNSTLIFYEGQTVTKEMLLENLFVYDKEDALSEQPLTFEDIRITKIVYSEGKIIDGEKSASYTEVWDDDVPEDFTLDTWFLQMEKENSPFSHKITYEVTDSEGLTAKLDREIFVEYNEYPELIAKDRHFTLKEAQKGKITLNSLLEDIRSTDKESCSSHSLKDEAGNSCLNGNKPCDFVAERVSIIGFNAESFKAFTKPGYDVLNCIVMDQFGKETVLQFTVYVIDDGEVSLSSQNMSVRSINKKYYEKNSDWYIENLTEEEVKKRNQNGGLQINSFWYTDPNYRSLIQDVLSEEVIVKKSWTFSSSEIKLIKKYIQEDKLVPLEFELKDG